MCDYVPPGEVYVENDGAHVISDAEVVGVTAGDGFWKWWLG